MSGTNTCERCRRGTGKVFYLVEGRYCFGCYAHALKDLAAEIEAGTVPSQFVFADLQRSVVDRDPTEVERSASA